MEHDPSGEATTGGSGHVERGDDQVGALLLTHGVSQDSTRVRITHGAQVDPALGVGVFNCLCIRLLFERIDA